MARLKTLGFELQSLTAGHEIDGTSGSGFSISTSTARSGAAALRCNHAVAASSWLWHQFGTSSPSNKVFYARFYIRLATAPSANTSLIELSDYNSQGTFLSLKYIQSSGALRFEYFNSSSNRVQIGSDSSALSTGTWYRIEIKADFSSLPTSCPVELKIDGTSVASGTITDFNNGVNHTMIGRFYLGIDAGDWGETATGDVFFDDIAINDGSGSFQNSYPGDGKVIYLLPNAAGDANSFATQTGGTAGVANNYTRVDETTPNDATDFNGSSTLNQEDLFNVTNSGIGASDTVNAVEVHGRFRNSTADATAKVTFEIEKTAAGTKTSSGAITPNSTTWRTNKAGGTAPLTAPIVTYQDPDASNWTQSTLDSMQIGYKLTTGPGTAGRRIDVTSVWAVVDYTPAASVTVTPPTASLTLATFAPTIQLPKLVTVGQASLTLSTFAPSVLVGQTAVPGTASLTLTTFAPTILLPKTITPGVAPLTLTTFAPKVNLGVIPGTASLSINTFAPTVAASDNKTVTPSTAILTLAGYAPTILLPKTVTPGAATLTIATFAPTVTAINNVVVTPDPVALIITMFAPNVRATATFTPISIILGTPGAAKSLSGTATTASMATTGSAASLGSPASSSEIDGADVSATIGTTNTDISL